MEKYFNTIANQIEERLFNSNLTIKKAIDLRQLYFRVSLVGACNIKCDFCHNEGAPIKGRQTIGYVVNSLELAKQVGFYRIQFTGGEPLVHPNVDLFIKEARSLFSDVGITTNGILLQDKIDKLIEAGINRIHISLQVEALTNKGNQNEWTIPEWLSKILDLSKQGLFNLRLNLPVPHDSLRKAEKFLTTISVFNCDVKIFSILPNIQNDINYPIAELYNIMIRENDRRKKYNQKGEIELRGYRSPTGIRCATCSSYNLCKEQSHSLRLGADRILRPCLASRKWDIPFHQPSYEYLRNATILALDFEKFYELQRP